MSKRVFFFASVFVFICYAGKAQISPPGLGTAHTAYWFAFGVRKQMNRKNTWQSLSYLGMGRKSDPDNYDPVLKPAIWVINQEFYHQLKKHFQYSFALSYRRQDEYTEGAPFKHETPGTEQEFRMYGRIYYTIGIRRFKLATIFRQEFRKFYAPDFSYTNEDFQLRSRFRLQLSTGLNKDNTQKLTASSEALFAASKETEPKEWTPFRYKEARFSLYYSLALQKIPVTFNMGYMNNLIGTKSPDDVHYLALDVLLNIPYN